MPEHTPAPTPSRAVYGFVLYLSFKMFFIIYIVWAVVPESWFEFIGITYLPQRYWALVIPIFILTVLTVFAFIIYPSLGLCMTPDISDLKTINGIKSIPHTHGVSQLLQNATTENSVKKCCENNKNCGKREYEQVKETFVKNCVPPLKDLDIVHVSKHLYLK